MSQVESLVVGGIVMTVVGLVMAYVSSIASQKKRDRNRRRELCEAFEKFIQPVREKTFVVVVRQRDGRKTLFETRLIEQMISKGITVWTLPTEDEQALWKDRQLGVLPQGALALVGTYWEIERTYPDPDLHYGDVRVFDSKGVVRAALSTYSKSSKEDLAELLLFEMVGSVRI